ncbi:MAG: cation:proton antiporter [Bacteroidales bacterium]|nr:cation:proton antiporter [Bacteroidales bacterium]
MIKKVFLIIIILCFGIGISKNLFAQTHREKTDSTQNTGIDTSSNIITDVDTVHSTSADQSQTEITEHSDTDMHEDEHHGGMEPLFFIIIALVIGAATRHFFRKIPLPFTVLLLLFGIGLGLLNRFGLFEGWGETISLSLKWAGHINPHAILFIFLPILIFEAAYAMDLHTFKKTVTNSIILAVPGIILALIMSGGLAILLKTMNVGLLSWEWNIALMFGAVISATDPVAVVALLKELGASKKLGTLIEGESLLNDGTAIVIFMVFFTAITGSASDTHVVLEFSRVAIGGILIGVIIGAVVIAWVKRVFNDALVEISIIIAAAYLVFFVAEHFMQMSGVLAIVAFGLAMAGIGKTRISPKVEHFLHKFWELAAFFANTIIFIIVGVVIAQRAEFTLIDFAVLGIFYIGIHIIRAIIIIMFYPAMKRIGYGLNKKEATVLWYGALRGAIGLALALVVVNLDDKYISAEIRNQFFFITAGIVTLTLLVNATTMKFIVNKLGLSKIAPAKALMIINAKQYLRSSTENAIERLKKDRFISNADWNSVKEYLPPEAVINSNQDIKIDTISEIRKRILEKEKSSYWHQFKEGLLGPTAVRSLSEGIDTILDDGGLKSLSERKDLELLMKTPKFLSKLQSISLLKRVTRHIFFERLAVSYDSARGFIDAQQECIKLVESMYRSIDPDDNEGNKNLEIIEAEINQNKIEGLTFIRNIRKTYPEIYDAIATRQAIRSLLNYELKTIERLQKNGRIDSEEASKMIHSVEERMKKLLLAPPKVKIPDVLEFLSKLPWLQNVNNNTLEKTGKLFKAKIYSTGNKLIKEGTSSDTVYLIARGTVTITFNDELIDIVGEGNIIGEIGILTGRSSNASVTADSPLSVFTMSNSQLKHLIEESAEFRRAIWKAAGKRIAAGQLRTIEPYCYMRSKKFKSWIDEGKIISSSEKKDFELNNEIAVLLIGKVIFSGSSEKVSAPAVINISKFSLAENSKIFICPVEEN